MLQTTKVKQSSRIVYVKHGLAYSVGGQVYLHEGLKDYPDLHNYLLNHELSHSCMDDYELADLFCAKPGLSRLNVWLFILTHPSTVWSYFPFMKVNGKWSFDPSLGLYYGIILSCSFYLCTVLIW